MYGKARIGVSIFFLYGLIFPGCTTTISQKRTLELPSATSYKAWSRAHSYIAQYGGDSFYILTDYALAAEDTMDGKTIMILREEYDEYTRIIIIAEKSDTGDSYYLRTELKQDVNSAKKYIEKGEIMEFDKTKRKPDMDRMKGDGRKGKMRGMRGMKGK